MKEPILWTALITPMHEDGTAHFSDLETLIRRQEAAGNGILLLGSTGEGISFTRSEKEEILKFAVSLEPDVPLMAGVAGFQLDEQIEWIRFCNELNIDSYLLVTPLYSKPALKGQIHWFRSLMDEADKKCMLYNIPSRSGIKLLPGVLTELRDHPRIWAVKEASGSADDFSFYRDTVPELPLYSGDDALLPEFSKFGCSGLVSVASNVWPTATSYYTELSLKGEIEEHLDLWRGAVKALFSAPNPTAVKIILHLKNLISTPALRPPLSEDDLASYDHLLKADRAVREWLENQKNRLWTGKRF